MGCVLDIASVLDGPPEQFDLSHVDLVLEAVVRQDVQREDVEEEALVVGTVLLIGKVSRGLAVADLGMLADQLLVIV